MRFRLPRRKPRAQAASPVEVVDLSTWNGRGDDVLTPISRPDSLGPIPHRLPALDPDQADLRLLVTQLVAELHTRGGLDAGHAAVLDHWIDSQLRGWLTVVEQQAEARRRATKQLLAVDRANLTREALELGQLRWQQVDLEAWHRHWLDTLAGHAPTPPQAATGVEAAAAPPMPDLPDYRPHTYLDDQAPDARPDDPADSTPPPADPQDGLDDTPPRPQAAA